MSLQKIRKLTIKSFHSITNQVILSLGMRSANCFLTTLKVFFFFNNYELYTTDKKHANAQKITRRPFQNDIANVATARSPGLRVEQNWMPSTTIISSHGHK